MGEILKIDEDGWLQNVEIVCSPNFDERPDMGDIRLLVVHGISLPPGQYGGDFVQQLFTNSLDPDEHAYFAQIRDLKVSAHCLITRAGRLIQFVSFRHRAWHAGVSCWQGSERCNDFSIGIELEGCDEDGYEEAQYHRLAELVIALRKQYPAILEQSLCGHSDIAPGRKTDPGPCFDWQHLAAVIHSTDFKPTDQTQITG